MLLVILQDQRIKKTELQRLIQFCETRFEKKATLASAAEPKVDVLCWPDQIIEAPSVTVYLKKKGDDAHLHDHQILSASKLYEIDTSDGQHRYRLTGLSQEIDCENLESHVFNRYLVINQKVICTFHMGIHIG